MVSTEILPRCSRVISASSDTTYLPCFRRPDASRLLRSTYLMTCNLQVIAAAVRKSLNYNHHSNLSCGTTRVGLMKIGRATPRAPGLKPAFAPSYLRKYVRRQWTSSSAPGPACGSTRVL